jgi:hypothetical protein
MLRGAPRAGNFLKASISNSGAAAAFEVATNDQFIGAVGMRGSGEVSTYLGKHHNPCNSLIRRLDGDFEQTLVFSIKADYAIFS